jgi:hypothetical protein
VWNPFDPKYSDPMSTAWQYSQAPGSFQDVAAQKGEVLRAVAVPFAVLLAAFMALRGNNDLAAFWNGQRGSAMLLQALAIVSVLAALVRLALVARRRYAGTATEAGMQPPPGWFRFLLAAMELGQVGGVLAIVLVQVLDLDRRWTDGVLICLAASAALAIGQHFLRWTAEPYGWVTGRLLWGRFD